MRKDVIATIGTYQKDGETQYIPRKVGQVFEHNGMLKMKLDASFNPAGCKAGEDGQIWLALFDPKTREPQQKQPQGGGGGDIPSNPNDAIDMDEEIPFITPYGMF